MELGQKLYQKDAADSLKSRSNFWNVIQERLTNQVSILGIIARTKLLIGLISAYNPRRCLAYV